MKKTAKIISLAISAALLLVSFAACGVIKGDTVMEYDGYKITEAMYSYTKSRFKASFINNYGVTVDGKKTVDWSKALPDGTTYEEFFEEMTDSYVKKMLVSQKLFDEYELDFSEDDEEEISERIEGLEKIYGGEDGLNSYLGDYGLNAKTLESIYYAEAKIEIVSDYIFSNSITVTDKSGYYKANYYCVNWIYIYTKKKPAKTDGGNNSDGSYIMEDMTEQEQAEKKALVQSIVSKLQKKEKSFAELKAEYCEDKYEDGTSEYDFLPNGFNLSANDLDYGAELIKLIQGMQIGEISTYEDEHATRIIVRNPLIEYTELTEQEKNVMEDFDEYVMQAEWDSIISKAKIELDKKVAARYNVKKVKAFTNLVV